VSATRAALTTAGALREPGGKRPREKD
jgi:hypothetical protein